jgi:Putative beta-barrel porin 2
MSFRTLLAVCTALLAMAQAKGQDLLEATSQSLGRPLSYRIGQELLIDSNVLRLPTELPIPASYKSRQRGDTISRTFGGLSYRNLIANQSVGVDLNAEVLTYSHFSSLNRSTIGLNSNLSGDFNRAWYYQFGLIAADSAGDFVNQSGFEANVVRNFGASSRLGLRFTPTWSSYLALSKNRRTNSARTLSSADSSQSTVELGLRFQPESGIDAEIGVSNRVVEFANRQTVDALGNPLSGNVSNSFQSDQLTGRINYRPSAQSRFAGSIGLGNTRFDELLQRNTSSILFGIDYRHTFSDLAEIGVQYAKDLAGDASSFSSPVVSTRLGLDATWRPTGRLSLTGQVKTNSRHFTFDPGVVSGANGLKEDKISSVSLIAQHELTRTVRLNAGFTQQARSSDTKNTSFKSTIFNVGVTINLD